MSRISVTVSIPNRDKFAGVVRRAQKVGLRVKFKYEDLGVAVGTIDERALRRLTTVPGVGTVEQERDYSASPLARSA